MSMTVHNTMAFNHHFFRPQPVVSPKQDRREQKAKSFQEVLNEKLGMNHGNRE